MKKNEDTPVVDEGVTEGVHGNKVVPTAADTDRYVQLWPADFDATAAELWKKIEEIELQRAEQERLMEVMKKNEKS